MKEYTKETLIAAIQDIRKMGWIENRRPGNDGGVGNTLEDLLGVTENNLPIPNAAEWELKTQRMDTSSLATLFHMEPPPQPINLSRKFFCLTMVGRIKRLAKNILLVK